MGFAGLGLRLRLVVLQNGTIQSERSGLLLGIVIPH